MVEIIEYFFGCLVLTYILAWVIRNIFKELVSASYEIFKEDSCTYDEHEEVSVDSVKKYPNAFPRRKRYDDELN